MNSQALGTACASCGHHLHQQISSRSFPSILLSHNYIYKSTNETGRNHHQKSTFSRRGQRSGPYAEVALIKNIDPTAYDVFVVSPRNYFLNTPLLPGVTVGTVEARSLIQPVRNLLPGGDVLFFYCMKGVL